MIVCKDIKNLDFLMIVFNIFCGFLTFMFFQDSVYFSFFIGFQNIFYNVYDFCCIKFHFFPLRLYGKKFTVFVSNFSSHH